MPKIMVNDISLYYEIHGEGEPLLLIGGFGVDHTTWSTLIPLLQKNFKLIVFDNRGIGQSEVPLSPYTIQQMADDVKGLCDQLKISEAYFIGSSMGGYILQALSYRYPALVKRSIISNSALSTETTFRYYLEAQLTLLKDNAALDILIKATNSWVFSFPFLSKPGVLENLITLGLENPFPFDIEGYTGQLTALKTFDSNSWVDKIRTPTLVFGGELDLIFSPKSVALLATKIPNAEYHCFKNCGHLPFVECPEAFAERVCHFFAQT